MTNSTHGSKLAIETVSIAMARVEQIEEELRVWSEKPIEFSIDPTGTPLFAIYELGRSYAKRSLDLVKAIRTLLAQDRIIPGSVLARALIETVAMCCLFFHDMNRLIAARDQPRLEDRVKRYYAGIKGHAIEPVHVMDAMRHFQTVDRAYIDYLANKYKFFSEFISTITDESPERVDPRDALSVLKTYDHLSEVSHPNGVGTQLLYPDPSFPAHISEQVRPQFRQLSTMAFWHCHHLITALQENEDLDARFKAALP